MTHLELLCVNPGSPRSRCHGWIKLERTMLGETPVRGWKHHLSKMQVPS